MMPLAAAVSPDMAHFFSSADVFGDGSGSAR